MTTEEKLQHFYDISIGEAKAEATFMVETYKQKTERKFAAYKQEKDQETAARLKEDSDRTARAVNKTFSASQLEIKRSRSHRELQLKDRLFQEVRQKLTDFMETPAYDDFLEAKIKKAAAFAGDEEFTILLAPADAPRAQMLSERTGVSPQISSHDFWGGIQAMIPGRNLLLDESFQCAFENERKNSIFNGGITYE